MKINNTLVPILFLLVAFLLPQLVHAQPSFTDDVVDAPVDGGLSLLIAGGIGYGVKKYKVSRLKNN